MLHRIASIRTFTNLQYFYSLSSLFCLSIPLSFISSFQPLKLSLFSLFFAFLSLSLLHSIYFSVSTCLCLLSFLFSLSLFFSFDPPSPNHFQSSFLSPSLSHALSQANVLCSKISFLLNLPSNIGDVIKAKIYLMSDKRLLIESRTKKSRIIVIYHYFFIENSFFFDQKL